MDQKINQSLEFSMSASIVGFTRRIHEAQEAHLISLTPICDPNTLVNIIFVEGKPVIATIAEPFHDSNKIYLMRGRPRDVIVTGDLEDIGVFVDEKTLSSAKRVSSWHHADGTTLPSLIGGAWLDADKIIEPQHRLALFAKAEHESEWHSMIVTWAQVTQSNQLLSTTKLIYLFENIFKKHTKWVIVPILSTLRIETEHGLVFVG